MNKQLHTLQNSDDTVRLVQKPALDGTFRKSTASGSENCVEVAKNSDGTVCVRDSKDPAQTVLTFTHDEWIAFLSGVNKGEFNI